jgi:hypothetical protein
VPPSALADITRRDLRLGDHGMLRRADDAISRMKPLSSTNSSTRRRAMDSSPELWLLPLDTRWALPTRGQELLYSLTHEIDRYFRMIRKFGRVSHDGVGDLPPSVRWIKRNPIAVVHEGEDAYLKVSVSSNQQLVIGNPCRHEWTFQAV